MSKKITIEIDDRVYDGLYAVAGPENIRQFLEELARPFVVNEELETAYRAMAADLCREADADEWCDALAEDGFDATR